MSMLLFASMKSIDLKLSIIKYSQLFIFVIESSYSLLFSEVSNIELFSTFLLSISNPAFIKNKYPSSFINRCITQFLNKKFSQRPVTQAQFCNYITDKNYHISAIFYTNRKKMSNSSTNIFSSLNHVSHTKQTTLSNIFMSKSRSSKTL